MWQPNFQIDPKLLRITRAIGESMGTIRERRLDEPKIAKLALEARSLSTFASTSIEGNPLPLTDVKRILKSKPNQVVDSEREVLNYNRALEWVQSQVQAGNFRPSSQNFEKIQGIVVEGLMDNPFDVGHLRQKPVVIRDPRSIDKVVFMPPDHGDVPKLLDDLFAFVEANLEELDPVLLAGLFHKQAVIIHPFMDGNGRSTRLMTSAILGLTGMDFFPIFSFEAYYNRNVTRYFAQVGERGDYYDLAAQIDFTNWLVYFAEGILDELKRVEKSLPRYQARLEPHLLTLLEHFEARGTLTQREYGELSDRSLAARKTDFAKLIELDRIEAVGQGRSRHYRLK